ncbi:glycosyltransferase family A protein [Salinibacterium sp.]|uniref:glycosyltransferase family A protein n=2 Tax=Salinibacterium sp. TaxID=1915057 RepID=UPI00286B7BEC|nr:glycosyltransferase family A protein [Salinibacterium sp.]
MQQSTVDVLIPVHSHTRPIARAVSSVLLGTSAPVKVLVIAHNIDAALIVANLGSLADDPRVQVLPFADGIPSPAGPFNFGIASTTSPFFSLLGSDDEFEHGAIDSWLSVQREQRASMVIARIQHVGGGNDASPLLRWRGPALLDPVKDRLTYRSAPLGLISRAAFGALRFTEGLPSGEDVVFANSIWFSGDRLAHDRFGPAYRGFTDGHDRVTASSRPVSVDFAFLPLLLTADWYLRLSGAARTSIAMKLLRLNVLDAVVSRRDSSTWSEEDTASLRQVVTQVLESAPGCERLLSRLDAAVIAAVRFDLAGLPAAVAALELRWELKNPHSVLSQSLAMTLRREGAARWLFASLTALTLLPREVNQNAT